MLLFGRMEFLTEGAVHNFVSSLINRLVFFYEFFLVENLKKWFLEIPQKGNPFFFEYNNYIYKFTIINSMVHLLVVSAFDSLN